MLLEDAPGDFRIDHDQKFNATTNLQYTFDQRIGAWVGLTWRYDSGLVAGAVGSLRRRAGPHGRPAGAIGLVLRRHLRDADRRRPAECTSSNCGATRLRIPAEGTEDDVTNPPRIAPRHLFDVAVGVDNLFRTNKTQAAAATERRSI